MQCTANSCEELLDPLGSMAILQTNCKIHRQLLTWQTSPIWEPERLEDKVKHSTPTEVQQATPNGVPSHLQAEVRSLIPTTTWYPGYKECWLELHCTALRSDAGVRWSQLERIYSLSLSSWYRKTSSKHVPYEPKPDCIYAKAITVYL